MQEKYQIINYPGKVIVLKDSKTPVDGKGRVPVWDMEKKCWRIIAVKWLFKV